MIRKQGDKWVVKTHDGKKVLGRHGSRPAAEAQLGAIEASKYRREMNKKAKNAG